jgi:hypothetical protein
MMPTQFPNHVFARAQKEMIGIGQHDARVQFFEHLLRERLHRRLRSDGHEDGRLHGAVRRVQDSGARARRWILGDELKGHHRSARFSLSHLSPIGRRAVNGAAHKRESAAKVIRRASPDRRSHVSLFAH